MHCRAQSWKKVIKTAGLVSKATSIMDKKDAVHVLEQANGDSH